MIAWFKRLIGALPKFTAGLNPARVVAFPVLYCVVLNPGDDQRSIVYDTTRSRANALTTCQNLAAKGLDVWLTTYTATEARFMRGDQ